MKSVANQASVGAKIENGTTHRATLLHKGCHLAYEVQGSGPPVVFIQGVGVHGSAWAPQIDAVAPHYERLSFDNRGLGRSQPIGASLSIAQMAEGAYGCSPGATYV